MAKLSKEEYMNYVGLNVSNEYNAFDWPKFFLSDINTVWRTLTGSSETTIEHPGLLVSLFLGKMTDLGSIVNILRGPVNFWKFFIDAIRDKGMTTGATHKSILGDTPNMYKVFFVDYKKVDLNNIKRYEEDFKRFKEVVEAIKKSFCKKCQSRKLSSSELGDLKLFRPQEIAKEIQEGRLYFSKQGKKWEQLAIQVENYINANIVKYILTNIDDKGDYIRG